LRRCPDAVFNHAGIINVAPINKDLYWRRLIGLNLTAKVGRDNHSGFCDTRIDSVLKRIVTRPGSRLELISSKYAFDVGAAEGTAIKILHREGNIVSL
jgi:hypothetical protein